MGMGIDMGMGIGMGIGIGIGTIFSESIERSGIRAEQDTTEHGAEQTEQNTSGAEYKRSRDNIYIRSEIDSPLLLLKSTPIRSSRAPLFAPK